MTPAPPQTYPIKHARTGFGWLLQTFTHPSPRPTSVDLFFPATERHPAIETFATSLLIALWSFIACVILCMQSGLLPESVTLRCTLAFVAWLTLIHSAVIVPLLIDPFRRLNPQKLAAFTEFAFLLLLTVIAFRLSNLPSLVARATGLFWLGLILAETLLRLARKAITLASRSR